MIRQLLVLLLFTTVLAGTFFYQGAASVCAVPISYRIGEIDERFDITEAEALEVLEEATYVWEAALEEELFTYDPEADFTINFIFDARQEFAEAEESFREKLNVTEGVNTVIERTYEELAQQYKTLEIEYTKKVTAYEQHLSAYNAQVAEYNEEGGAPPDVYEVLQEEQKKLSKEAQALDQLGSELNQLAREINTIGERGNQLVEVYNHNVSQYNEAFGDVHEFTQGDYQGNHINVYKFSSITELKLVLAHELGHALSLDHVENDESILYYLMGGQPKQLRLSEEDVAEFKRVCAPESWRERIRIAFNI